MPSHAARFATFARQPPFSPARAPEAETSRMLTVESRLRTCRVIPPRRLAHHKRSAATRVCEPLAEVETACVDRYASVQ